MEVTLHMFRHAEENSAHRKDPRTDPVRQGQLTTKGLGETIDVGTLLKERIPDAKGVNFHFITSLKARATGTARAPYLRLKNTYRKATFHNPVEDKELDLPKGDPALTSGLFESMGRAAYMEAWAAGKLPPGIESQTTFNARIAARTLGRGKSLSLAKGNQEKHVIIVTHDGGTTVPSGFGAVFTKLTRLDPQAIEDATNNYKGPMRTGEYVGVKLKNGKAMWAEFRGRVFAPGKKGKVWREIEGTEEETKPTKR
ncbi:MAG: hypothetical protein Q8R15_02230 [Candidatus Micrarchaeota archaeon]|nr:hypothetical protein [Candidatus Micrarchaeota archaeon]